MVLTAPTQTQACTHREIERERGRGEGGGEQQKGSKKGPYNIKCYIFSLSATF